MRIFNAESLPNASSTNLHAPPGSSAAADRDRGTIKGRFQSESSAFLWESGIEIPPHVELRLYEDFPGAKHFVLPDSKGSSEIPSSDPVIQRAATDESFKRKLLKDSGGVSHPGNGGS